MLLVLDLFSFIVCFGARELLHFLVEFVASIFLFCYFSDFSYLTDNNVTAELQSSLGRCENLDKSLFVSSTFSNNDYSILNYSSSLNWEK